MEFINVDVDSGKFHYIASSGPNPGAHLIQNWRVLWTDNGEAFVPLINPSAEDTIDQRLWNFVLQSTGLNRDQFVLAAKSWKSGYMAGQRDARNNTTRRFPVK